MKSKKNVNVDLFKVRFCILRGIGKDGIYQAGFVFRGLFALEVTLCSWPPPLTGLGDSLWHRRIME